MRSFRWTVFQLLALSVTPATTISTTKARAKAPIASDNDTARAAVLHKREKLNPVKQVHWHTSQDLRRQEMMKLHQRWEQHQERFVQRREWEQQQLGKSPRKSSAIKASRKLLADRRYNALDARGDQHVQYASQLHNEPEDNVLDLTMPSRREQEKGCKLCADGTDTAFPTVQSSSVAGWTCGDLGLFVESSLGPEEPQCLEFQVIGFVDCGCTTSPLQQYCALCSSPSATNPELSVGSIPEASLSLPIGISGLTCADIDFVDKQNPKAGFSCADAQGYQQYCGCPSDSLIKQPGGPTAAPGKPPTGTLSPDEARPACSFCADPALPVFGDRVIPYLTVAQPGQSNMASFAGGQGGLWSTTTCAEYAQQAASSATVESCFEYIFPPVPVDVQSFCGCTGAIEWNLCSLCPDSSQLFNRDIPIPAAGGRTCAELDDYLRYVTDEASCNDIAEVARTVCCQALEPCPVCGNADYPFLVNKLYPPYGLTCRDIGYANQLGVSPLTCQAIQERFGFYCGCPTAPEPACTICAGNAFPPDPTQAIPMLGPGVTCGEINDYASLRSEEACFAEISSLSVDVGAYCGCDGLQPRGTCSLSTSCPAGNVWNPDVLVVDTLGLSSTDSAIGQKISCSELAEFAPYVQGASLCKAAQGSTELCCQTQQEGTAQVDPTSAINSSGQNDQVASEQDAGTTVSAASSSTQPFSSSTHAGSSGEAYVHAGAGIGVNATKENGIFESVPEDGDIETEANDNSDSGPGDDKLEESAAPTPTSTNTNPPLPARIPLSAGGQLWNGGLATMLSALTGVLLI